MQFLLFGMGAVIIPVIAAVILQPRANLLLSTDQANQTTSSKGNDLLLPTLNFSNASDALTNITTIPFAGPVRCLPSIGGPLNVRTCYVAYRAMMQYLQGMAKPQFTIGRRGAGIYDIASPLRFLNGTSMLFLWYVAR